MKGTIRTDEKCPKCGGKFQLTVIGQDLDLLCPTCKTRPRRYYVDIHHEGQRTRIFSSRQGRIFDAFQGARTTLGAIREEIERAVFDRTKYVKRDQKPLLVENYCEFWYRTKEEDGHKPATLHYTRWAINNYIVPYFRGRDIRDLRKRHARQFLNNVPISCRKNIRAQFQALLNFSHDNEDREHPLKVPPVKVADRKTPIWLTRKQQDEVLSKVPGIDQPPVRLQIVYGCRTGEVCALQWDCIDFEKGTITIRRNFSYRVLVDSPKEEAWKHLPMVPEIRKMLLELHAKRKDLIPWVFGKAKNKYWHYRSESLQRIWSGAATKAGFPGLKLHYNRHSFILQRLEAGYTYEQIAPITGHHDIGIMQKHYGRMQPQKLGKVVEMKTVSRVSVRGKKRKKST